MNVREALGVESLHAAKLVAGASGLEREVRWAHVIDMPDPAPWVRPGQLLLTTGFAWPQSEREQREQIGALTERGLAAMALAVPRYVDHFTSAAIAEADLRGLPLLEIPFEVPFAQITEELHRAILAEQYRVIERSEAIHRELTRAATTGTDLGDLARTLGGLIGRAITFEDPNGKLLASYEAGTHGDAIRRETLENQQSPAHTLDALESSGLLARIRASSGPLRVPSAPELGLVSARVVCPIRIGAELVGLVWIIEGESALSELDNRAAEQAALVAALHIAHQRELANMESRLGYASFLSLLEAETDDAQAIERARLLGFDTEGRHRVGIAVIPEPLPLSRDAFLRRERVAATLRVRLEAAGSRPLITAQLNHVAFLVPDGIAFAGVVRGLGEEAVGVVLGRAYRGTHGARRSYREAQSLLNYRKDAAILTFEEALVPRVLMGDASARDSFIDELFGPLKARKGGATLREALLALARTGFNFKETAVRLKIHPNTLRYRLTNAAETTHLDLEDPEVRFRLQLAVRLLEFPDKNEKENCGAQT
jgi:PucR family transcriptional regulator, purine catabolism regulatory protein